MDVSTEYSRWTLGLLSQLPWAPTPVPEQPQHGVHLSTMKTLRTGLSKAEVTYYGHYANSYQGQRSRGSKTRTTGL